MVNDGWFLVGMKVSKEDTGDGGVDSDGWLVVVVAAAFTGEVGEEESRAEGSCSIGDVEKDVEDRGRWCW